MAENQQSFLHIPPSFILAKMLKTFGEGIRNEDDNPKYEMYIM